MSVPLAANVRRRLGDAVHGDGVATGDVVADVADEDVARAAWRTGADRDVLPVGVGGALDGVGGDERAVGPDGVDRGCAPSRRAPTATGVARRLAAMPDTSLSTVAERRGLIGRRAKPSQTVADGSRRGPRRSS